MIDKKPFRVTNEQAKKDVVMNSATIQSTVLKILAERIQAYSADLLDSRELIDKQEALIKEMRGIVSTLWHDGCAEDYRKCCAILEKTKDYA